jgi:hypothetical protein
MLRFINWYIGKLHLAAANDSTLTSTFLKVVNLMIPPPSLLSPSIAWRVWRGTWKPALSVPSRALEATRDTTRELN